MEHRTQVNTEIVNLQKEFLKAAREKNSAFMEENLHPYFVFTSPRAVILNKETFTKDFVMNPDLKFEIFQLTEEQTITLDNTALLHCLVQARPVGKPDLWERVSFTLIQENGKWQLLSMNATFVPA